MTSIIFVFAFIAFSFAFIAKVISIQDREAEVYFFYIQKASRQYWRDHGCMENWFNWQEDYLRKAGYNC